MEYLVLYLPEMNRQQPVRDIKKLELDQMVLTNKLQFFQEQHHL